MANSSADVVPGGRLSNDYTIRAVPDVTSVTPGAEMKYVCLYKLGENYPTVAGGDYWGLEDSFTWLLIPESAIIRSKSMGEIAWGMSQGVGPEWQHTWSEDPGKYIVFCCINRYKPSETWARLEQRVTPLEAAMSRMWYEGPNEAPKPADNAVEYWDQHIEQVKLSHEKIPPPSIDFNNPDQALTMVPPNSIYADQIRTYVRYQKEDPQYAARVAQNANENFQREQHTKFNQKIRDLQEYRDKLAELLKPTDGKVRFPIKALHYRTQDQHPTWLNVFVCKMGSTAATQPAKQTWRLVDWSFPTLDLPKQFDEDGETDEAALANLFDTWNHYRNKYPPGRLEFKLILPQAQLPPGGFETDGTTRWGHVVIWLGIVATSALLVTGVGFLCGPAVLMFGVTGEAVASTGVWVMVFSSTAAATINIVERHKLSIGSWTDDVFDGLTIVGNMLAGIGALARVAQVAEAAAVRAAWARGAYLEVTDVSGKVLKGCLIGQVGDNLIQGVLVAAKQMKEYDKLTSDPNISPDERATRFVEWVRNTAFAGLMTVISLKSSFIDDIQALNQEAKIAAQAEKFSEDPHIIKTPKEKLDMVGDPERADPDNPVKITTKPVAEGKVPEPEATTKRQVTKHTTTAKIPGTGAVPKTAPGLKQQATQAGAGHEWFRGEIAEGVRAKDFMSGERGPVHDLGDGTYFTDTAAVAREYAEIRALDFQKDSGKAATKIVLSGKLDETRLGRVLDLTNEPDFMAIFNFTKEHIPKVSGEPYRNMFEGFLKSNNLDINNFDIIIGPEGIRGGNQMCIRNPELVTKVRASMSPLTLP